MRCRGSLSSEEVRIWSINPRPRSLSDLRCACCDRKSDRLLGSRATAPIERAASGSRPREQILACARSETSLHAVPPALEDCADLHGLHLLVKEYALARADSTAEALRRP